MGKYPVLKISSTNVDHNVEEMVQNNRSAFQMHRESDEAHRIFSYARMANFIFFICLEVEFVSQGLNKSTFKIIMLNLEDGQSQEIKEFERVIPDYERNLAAQMIFIKRELDNQFCSIKYELNDDDIRDFLNK